jgi:hypothetical protein
VPDHARTTSPRLRALTALIPASLSAGVSGWLLATQSWSSIGVEAMQAKTPSGTSFADLANITLTAQCLTDGADYSVCDPYGRPFQPYVVLPARILSAFGLGPAHTGPLGIALAVIYVITIIGLGLWLARQWRGSDRWLIVAQCILGLGAISAPAMLAVERGQIELLTFALTVWALLSLQSPRLSMRISGAVASLAAVMSKFFAVGLFAPFVHRGRPNLLAIAGLVASLFFLALSWSNIQQAGSAAGAQSPATSKSQFGSATLVATVLTNAPVGYIPSESVIDMWPTVRLLGWATTAIAVLVITAFIPGLQCRALDASPTANALLIGSTGILMLPYVLGVSHDYRQIFLLPMIAAALVWGTWVSGRARWLPFAVALAALVSLATGASMVPTPGGLIWPKSMLVVGDICLLFVLATGAGVWLRRWMPGGR